MKLNETLETIGYNTPMNEDTKAIVEPTFDGSVNMVMGKPYPRFVLMPQGDTSAGKHFIEFARDGAVPIGASSINLVDFYKSHLQGMKNLKSMATPLRSVIKQGFTIGGRVNALRKLTNTTARPYTQMIEDVIVAATESFFKSNILENGGENAFDLFDWDELYNTVRSDLNGEIADINFDVEGSKYPKYPLNTAVRIPLDPNDLDGEYRSVSFLDFFTHSIVRGLYNRFGKIAQSQLRNKDDYVADVVKLGSAIYSQIGELEPTDTSTGGVHSDRTTQDQLDQPERVVINGKPIEAWE